MLTRAQQVHGERGRSSESAKHLNDKAQKCRELADTAMTEDARSILSELAQRYEAEAATAARSVEAPAFSDAIT